MTNAQVQEEGFAATNTAAQATPRIGLEQYYEEAGPDYAAWSREFNMHFGYYRWGANPLRREGMLEQMNGEVLGRLRVEGVAAPRLLDLGCGLGATLRSFARRLPQARITGMTRVPWQVEQACALNRAAGCGERVKVLEGDYEDTILPRANYDGVYALESSCHAHGADKGALLKEAHRLLKPGGRLVVADGFLASGRFAWRAAGEDLPQAVRVLGDRGTGAAGSVYGEAFGSGLSRHQRGASADAGGSLGGAYSVGDAEVSGDGCAAG